LIKCAKDVKSKRGANGDSDHFLVIVKVKIMLSNQWKRRNRRTNNVRFDADKLEDVNILQQFQLGVKDALDATR